MSAQVTAPAARLQPIPVLAGIGLRDPIAQALDQQRPRLGFLEIHSENYFSPWGERSRMLDLLRPDYALSLHGVGLSLGSTDPLDTQHLAALKRLLERTEPMLVSEHVCWCGVDGAHYNELLPLPYTEESLRHLVSRVSQVQETLQRSIALENLSSYLSFTAADYSEPEFLAELARRSGCQLLLDINNVYVSAVNHGLDTEDYIAALPSAAIAEYHLGGHSQRQFQGLEFLIDTHDAPVAEPVWALYAQTLAIHGPRPTLIEWDSQLPPLADLLAMARRADGVAREVLDALTA